MQMLFLQYLVVAVLLSTAGGVTDPGDTQALLDFAASVNQPNLWLSGSDPCDNSWPYVGCNGPKTRVISLIMCETNTELALSFVGTIPESIGNLSALETLRLCNLGIVGTSFFISRIVNLTTSSAFEGTLPSGLGRLTAARDLEISRMTRAFLKPSIGINGTIPDMRNLSSLTRLKFAELAMFGTIPAWLGQLTSLTELGLNLMTPKNFLLGEYVQGFNGTIPASLGNLTNLKQLDLSDNSLTGTIPSSLRNLKRLEYLLLYGQRRLNYTGLTGELPSWLGEMDSLVELQLQESSLEGEIPLTLGLRSQMGYLDISSNSLNGTIPGAILANMTMLVHLFLKANNFSGTIPDVFGNHSKLEHLDLSFNVNLHGTLPRALSNLSVLTELNVEGSGISGCLAAAKANLADGNCKASGAPLVCSCHPNCTALSTCTRCGMGNTCYDSLYVLGATCDGDGDCDSGFCSNLACASVPLPTATSPPLVVASNLGGAIAAIVVSLIVAIGVALIVGLLIRRQLKLKRKATQTKGYEKGSAQPLLRALAVSASDLQIVQELGKGSSGSVHLATYNGEFVAVKRLNFQSVHSPDDLEELLSEANVMASIRENKNVVKLIGVCRDESSPAIVMVRWDFTAIGL